MISISYRCAFVGHYINLNTLAMHGRGTYYGEGNFVTEECWQSFLRQFLVNTDW